MKRQPRFFNWGVPSAPPPEHPYRDTAIVYGFFAVVIVLIAWATGGPVLKALILAVAFFFAAVVWSWLRFHQRVRRAAREERQL